MEKIIDNLIRHYATVTNGESALFRETLLQICEIHDVSESEFCHGYAKRLAAAFVAGEIDADGAAFAADDLHEASDFALNGFALRVFDALEYMESSPAEVRDLLYREVASLKTEQQVDAVD